MKYVTYPVPGSIIFIYFLGIFRHKGIVSDRWFQGKPMVIANANRTGGVKEIAWDVFTEGADAYLLEKPSNVSTHLILNKARGLIGSSYDLGNFNCEHFVEVAYGRKSCSSQVNVAILLASFGILLVSLSAAAQN